MKRIISLTVAVLLMLLTASCASDVGKEQSIPATDSIEATEVETTEETAAQPPKSLKVLSVGNSLSRDGMHYLPEIAEEAGIKDIVFAYLYIGNCSLATHLENAQSNKNAYEYYENRGDGWKKRENTSMGYALKAESWDYITLQQASGKSGVAASYKPLSRLIDIVLSQAKGEPELLWHITWAYGSDCKYKGFAKYGYDQLTMYNKMIECVKSEVLTDGRIRGVIPVGTAIQNGRSTYLGDSFTRDGRHLDRRLGRYLAALTWYSALTGADTENISFNPDEERLSGKAVETVKQAVNKALKEPFRLG